MYTFVKIQELKEGQKHKVTALKKVNTKYGAKPVAVIDDQSQVFLPASYVSIIDSIESETIDIDNLFLMIEKDGDELVLKFLKE